jgi:hypothetical protein
MYRGQEYRIRVFVHVKQPLLEIFIGANPVGLKLGQKDAGCLEHAGIKI